MGNINETARLADAMGRRITKKDAFKRVRDLVSDGTLTPEQAAPLYRYFLPPTPRAPKTAFDWVAKAVAKSDLRYELQFVWVENSRIVATDGHRLHIAPNENGLEPGYYNVSGDKVYAPDYMTYPKFDVVIPKGGDYDVVNLAVDDMELTEIDDGVLAYALPARDGDCFVQRPYILDAVSMEGRGAAVEWRLTDKHSVVVSVLPGGRLALIMPLRQ